MGCRVWNCLAQEPPDPENLDELLKFLFSLLYQAGSGDCLIESDDVTCILDECFPSLDPKLLSLEGYACLKLCILKVSKCPRWGTALREACRWLLCRRIEIARLCTCRAHSCREIR